MSARAERGFFANLNPLVPLRQLAQHRGLLWQFTARNFHLRHKGSYLGVAWAALSPLLFLSVYFVVVRGVFKSHFGVLKDETGADYALALLIGLTVAGFLTEIIAQAPMIIVSQPNLVKKVVFPVELLPAAALGASFVNFLISFVLVILGIILFGRGLTESVCWLPLLVPPVILLGLGLGWLLSSLGVFFRDISQVTQVASLLLMWASAVFFSITQVTSPLFARFLQFNPVAQIIELLRDALVWQQPIDLAHLGWLYASSLLTCLVGFACFASLRPSFSDVI